VTTPTGIAVVTGAGRGIGRVLTERLTSNGWQVVAVGMSAERIDAVADATGATPLVLDVSDAAAVGDAWPRVTSRFGVPNLLVNNAGVSGASGPTWTQDPVDWWRVFEINVLGTFLMSRAALPSMIDAGAGRIVNVSSNAAFYPIDGEEDSPIASAYMSSKAAVIRFTEALAGEAARHGVTAFAISPGMVRTDMTAGVFSDLWDEPDIWTPAETTADLVEFLASGSLDALSGRYIHAANDDWRSLADRADTVLSADLHSLRVRSS
jgi:NAD(P)-dependent dehydrogenase (short-subunit alcohol dehydrogenase family)